MSLQRCVIRKMQTACSYDCVFIFFNDTATTEIYTLSLHDALPIWLPRDGVLGHSDRLSRIRRVGAAHVRCRDGAHRGSEHVRSEEHTSELQSRPHLVCRTIIYTKKSHEPRHLTVGVHMITIIVITT